MTTDEKKRFKQLADSYSLEPTDFWKSPQGFVIISRRGIEKIQNGLDAEVTFEVVPEFSDPAGSMYVIKAKGTVRGDRKDGLRFNEKTNSATITAFTKVRVVETFGESSPKNTRGGAQSYPVAMAEKRALSRCVLKLSDFYTLNVLGEDELSE